MSLLPERHPNLDFFVLDITDAVPKDDLASMEHPLFSLATKPDMGSLHKSDYIVRLVRTLREHLRFQSDFWSLRAL